MLWSPRQNGLGSLLKEVQGYWFVVAFFFGSLEQCARWPSASGCGSSQKAWRTRLCTMVRRQGGPVEIQQTSGRNLASRESQAQEVIGFAGRIGLGGQNPQCTCLCRPMVAELLGLVVHPTNGEGLEVPFGGPGGRERRARGMHSASLVMTLAKNMSPDSSCATPIDETDGIRFHTSRIMEVWCCSSVVVIGKGFRVERPGDQCRALCEPKAGCCSKAATAHSRSSAVFPFTKRATSSSPIFGRAGGSHHGSPIRQLNVTNPLWIFMRQRQNVQELQLAPLVSPLALCAGSFSLRLMVRHQEIFLL